MNRATGKTYRTVLKSLINASEGKTVFHISPTIGARDVAFNHGINATRSIDAGTFVNHVDNMIEFPNGGGVKFITSETNKHNERRNYYRTLSHVILERDLY